MTTIGPYGVFTGRRLYSSSKIDNEIEGVLHRQSKLEPHLRMPTNPNDSVFTSQRAGHSSRAEWLREAKEWERGLVGTEDDKRLKERIRKTIVENERGGSTVPGHIAIIPPWMKIGERAFKRYYGIDYFGGKHATTMMPSLADLQRMMLGNFVNMSMSTGSSSPTTTAGFQEAINFLSAQGTNTSYAQGGVLEVFPGFYSCSSPWQLPSSTATAFDFTMRGGGKSNTLISIAPTGSQTAAIKEGYNLWIKGTMGPRFVAKELSMDITGTYSGTTAPSGDSSGGGVVSLQFYSVYFDHVGISINVNLTAVTNLLKAGTFAGPSQPCVWNDFHILGFAGANLASVATAWFEGFTWQTGACELQSGGNKGTGINIRSNGPNYLGQIDSYDYLAPGGVGVNCWLNFVAANGIVTLDELEYPFLANIFNGVNGGSVGAGPGNCLTIIGIQNESAIYPGDPSQFAIWNGGAKYLKTIGFSLGLQNGSQWVSSYLTGPFNNNVAGVGYLVGPNTYNGAKAPTASTVYTASSDLIVNSSGGSGVNITIYDQLGNVILSGLSSLSGFRMSIGMRVNFGAFTAAPAVTVFQVGS
ncbi:MAG TPA: hypothetical protein VMS77_10095 [Conexivisphaerales archaeon]|nr:hypothetical protein [Conexivisphaerales archaeon]